MNFSLFHQPQNYETAQSISPISILFITICTYRILKGPPSSSTAHPYNLHEITATVQFLSVFLLHLFFLVMKLIFCCFYVVLCYVCDPQQFCFHHYLEPFYLWQTITSACNETECRKLCSVVHCLYLIHSVSH